MNEELRKIIVRKHILMYWKRCPKLYEYVVILKMPFPPTVELQFGRGFHSQAKRFFDELDYEKLQRCVTKEEAYNLFADFLPWQPVVREWMTNFLWFEATRWEALHDLTYWKPLATEMELISEALGYEMHVDRVDRLMSGNLINIEYKTGTWWYLSDLRFEGAFYNLGINSTTAFDKMCTHFGVYNPTMQKQLVEPISSRLINRVNRTVLDFRRSVAKEVFPPRPQFLCRYCVFLERCLDAGILMEEFRR